MTTCQTNRGSLFDSTHGDCGRNLQRFCNINWSMLEDMHKVHALKQVKIWTQSTLYVLVWLEHLILPDLSTSFMDVFLLVYNSDQDFITVCWTNQLFFLRSIKATHFWTKRQNELFEAKGQHKKSFKITCSTQTPMQN